MTRVEAPSRLHFGLLNSRGAATDSRLFGGCGVMIEEPRLVVEVNPAEDWHATGPHAERALHFAKQTTEYFKDNEYFEIKVQSAPPEHVGLGLGTQLAMAISTAVAREIQIEASPEQLAQATGRGGRSAIGFYGFQHGGFLVDGGHWPWSSITPLIIRTEFPTEWPIVLIRPNLPANWFGPREQGAFVRVESEHLTRVTAEMCLKLTLGMIPALMDSYQSYMYFSEALWDYNRLAGEAFREEQGGIYSAPILEELANYVHTRGCHAVGQSSWGPTLFAICPNMSWAEALQRDLQSKPGLEVTITRAANHGARIIPG